jgi:4-hydroxybenzoyl-CoA thioesterase
VISVTRPIRFEEVDAAGIVFFGQYLAYAHEAMEAFFAGLEGGYAHLVMKRRIGLPAVHVEADYQAPLRYGDVLTIETTAAKVGNTSCTLAYRFLRQDGIVAATVRHTCVLCDLESMQKIPIPADVRAILEAHGPA